jgi:glycosyltransferase involved in cell wall biosynthesis
MIYLSILITTLEVRKDQFEKLQEDLNKQLEESNLQDEVEILTFCDNFEYPVGMKRNELLEQASGLFVAFVDDDDVVAENYVKIIVDTIKTNPNIDCIGIRGKLISKSLGNKEFIHSLKYNNYSEDKTYYYRPPNHLNPIRAAIAKHFKFPILNRGEDADWAMQIAKKGVLLREVFINQVLYYYIFDWDKTEAQKVRIIFP